MCYDAAVVVSARRIVRMRKVRLASPPSPSFGTLLKRFRVAALLTQEQLAVRAQLSPDTIRALERGKRRIPRPDSMRLLADALSLSGAELALLLAAAQPPESPTRSSDQSMPRRAEHHLSTQPNLFVGRASELETIRQRLTGAGSTAGADGDTPVERARLLTLTGPAGVGKTRLALTAAAQIAQRFPDGVVFVDLTPVREAVSVLPTIAFALGLSETGGRPLSGRLNDYLRERTLLLVLDNFEQVLPAASALADTLASCPGLSLLVTSRVPLRLRWEWTLRVGPLPVHDVNTPLPPQETLIAIPAIALFLERARARRADFAMTATQAPLVARLTSELDGLPLAIELAAARLDTLSLPMITHRLGHRLRVLRWEAPDLPERQQSLDAAVGWSYDLLSESEQQIFRCLGVFSGQVTLAAIATVVADHADEADILGRLISLAEKSLVLPAPRLDESGEDSEPAFSMLETVREYAWERLERLGELEAACKAHAHYFLSLAERADPYLRGRDQRIWYFHLEREHNNLRAALRWLLSQDGLDGAAERAAGLRLAAALGWFWWTRGYVVEGARWLSEALECAPEADPALRSKALYWAGAMLTYQGAFDRARAALDESLALARRWQHPTEIAQAYSYLGLCAVYAGEASASIPMLREALGRGKDLGDPHPVGMTLMFLGAALFAQGADEQAISIYLESLAQFEAAGDMLFAVNIQLNLGWFAWRRGDLASAVGRIRLGIEAGVTADNRGLLGFGAQTALALLNDALGPDSLSQTDYTRHARLLGAIDALTEATGMTLMQSVVKDSMAELRARIQQAGLEAVYREGKSLSFQAIAALALALLDEVDQTLTHAAAVSVPGPANAQRPTSSLSARQREILGLVAQGMSNKAIGRQLFLSTSTVNYHLTAIFNKLGVGTRAQAVAVATRDGLL
jgi:predicted ATPase/DNA-binding CsgD family transcriptional regulator/transcriptional regulator with XRE-family HTH domain